MRRITEPTIQPFETEHIEAVRSLAAECTLLLKSDGLLPLKQAGKIALYGSGARKTLKGGTGSGDVNVRHFSTIEEGLEKAGFTVTTKKWLDSYDEKIAQARAAFIEQVKKEAKELGINPVMYGMGKAMPEPEYEFALDGEGNLAVYVLSRISGEGADRSCTPGDIGLSETEIRDIRALNRNYEHFLLVLNVGGMVDLSPVEEVKNILLLGQLGTPTADVLADLLLGKSYPSGKLSMTWASIEDYPSTEGFGDMDDTRYREGIYVGYRYFDTADIEPSYPFGFGLSYTSFVVKAQGFAADEKEVRVTVAVENTGTHPGKEVVQVYAGAPEGKLDKPAKELVAFAKTKELRPGETETLTLVFETASMASYDTGAAAYRMEQGGYRIYVGNSSRNTELCGIVSLDGDVLTRQVKNICPGWDFEDWKPERTAEVTGADGMQDAGFGKNGADDDVPTVRLHAADMETEMVCYAKAPAELPNTGACTWQEVVEGAKTLDEFVGSLDEKQLASLCVGRFEENGGMGSIIGSSAVKVSGAAGETTAGLEGLGVPTLVMADGPAGIRISTEYKVVNGQVKSGSASLSGMADFMEPKQLAQMAAMVPKPTQEELDAPLNYQYCVAIPIGTALAQTWNPDACKKCGDIVGGEMETFGVHLWLAPAMNIQRSPLCGRNFEYYSEDPLLSGNIAAAVTKGVQAHKGCGVTIKHFTANNQETNRMVSNSIVSERALREIYLKGFEICVKKAQPHALMSSYNLICGEHSCNSYDLLTAVLRDEWGYEGVVMTDWYAASSLMVAASQRKNKHTVGSPAGCVKAGNDITMPGTPDDVKEILAAAHNKAAACPLTKAELQTCAKRVLETVLKLA